MAKDKYIKYYKNKNILITGGTGLIGMPLAQMLIDQGAKILIVSLDKKPKLKGKFKFLKKDLRESQIVSTGSFEIKDPRDRLLNKSEICIKPKNTKEVSKILRLAYKLMIPIIPVGGSTGLVGGQIANETDQVILSLEKLNEIKKLAVLSILNNKTAIGDLFLAILLTSRNCEFICKTYAKSNYKYKKRKTIPFRTIPK